MSIRASTLNGLAPEVVAHRGGGALRPEHTVAAYRLAVEHGASMLECDVRLTADQHLVCHHDRRLERTSNGTGNLSSFTLAELAELDFGSWQDYPTRGILTLSALLDLIQGLPRPIGLAVETKHPNKFGSAVEELLAQMLTARGLHEPGPGVPPVRIMSFSPLALAQAGEDLPLLPRVLLVELGVVPMVRAGRLPFGIDACGISVRLLHRDPGMVRRLHEHGHAVHVYTVDEPEDLELCLTSGVDAIITNRPGDVRQRVARMWESS